MAAWQTKIVCVCEIFPSRTENMQGAQRGCAIEGLCVGMGMNRVTVLPHSHVLAHPCHLCLDTSPHQDPTSPPPSSADPLLPGLGWLSGGKLSGSWKQTLAQQPPWGIWEGGKEQS